MKPVTPKAVANGFSPQLIHQTWESAMHAGDFETAWRATDMIEARRRARGWREAANGELLWDGSDFAGKRVLVRCLHGLGDTLQFMRFIPRLRALAAEVIFAPQPALLPLIESDGRYGRVMNGWTDDWPEYDAEIEIMELAYALRVTTEDLARDVPYLDAASIQRKSVWRPPPEPSGMKVGLIWKASHWDDSRSLPGEALAALQSPEATFYSLQQEVTDLEIEALPMRLICLAQLTQDPLDAAAAMLWMDHIVTVDAMPAHLAGALGRPVSLILKCDADWRWMREREDSPWYPTFQLFRRERDWDETLNSVRRSLSRSLVATENGTVGLPLRSKGE